MDQHPPITSQIGDRVIVKAWDWDEADWGDLDLTEDREAAARIAGYFGHIVNITYDDEPLIWVTIQGRVGQ